MGSLLRRPGGRLVIQWVDGAGEKRQRTVRRRRADGTPLSPGALEREARRLMAELEDLADRQRDGRAPRLQSLSGVTFADLRAFWESTRGASCRSRTFIAFVNPHVAELDPRPVADVTTAVVDQLLTARASRLSPKSVMHIRGHLSSIFEAARVKGGPWEGRENPVTASRRFKPAETAVHLVTPSEWPQLAPELPEAWRGHVAVAFFTGLRRGDIFGLRKADVDLGRGVITAAISKSRKWRILPIPEPLRPYLEAAMQTPGAALFEWERERELPQLAAMLQRACRRAGLVTGWQWRCRRRKRCGWMEEHSGPDAPETCPSCGHPSVYARGVARRVRFHDLRHSFGTAVVAEGGTGAGQALLAHSDPRMTQRYTHLADGFLGGVVARAFEGARAADPTAEGCKRLQAVGGASEGRAPDALAQGEQREALPGFEPARGSSSGVAYGRNPSPVVGSGGVESHAVERPGPSIAPRPPQEAAPGLQLLPVPVGLFTRAAALVAKRAAKGGATTAELEAIIARGTAQAARLAEAAG